MVEAAAKKLGVPKSCIRTVIDKYGIDYAPHYGKPGIVRLADLELLFEKLARCRRWNQDLETEWLARHAASKRKHVPEAQQWQPGPPQARLENLPHYRCAGLYRLVEISIENVEPNHGDVKVGATMLYTLNGKEIVCIVTKKHHLGMDAVALDSQEYGHYPSVIFRNIPFGALRNPPGAPAGAGGHPLLGEVVYYTSANRDVLPCVVTKVKNELVIDAVVFGSQSVNFHEDRHALPVPGASQFRIGQISLCRVNNYEIFPCIVTRVYADARPRRQGEERRRVENVVADVVLFGNEEYGIYPKLQPTLPIRNVPIEYLSNC